MQLAYLPNGTVVQAAEYKQEWHGDKIYCVDVSCRAPVHFVKEGEKVAFFKTSGKLGSVHAPTCAFARKLDFEKTIEKIDEVAKSLGDIVEPIVVRFNFDKLDPDYVPRERAERAPQELTSRNIAVPTDTKKSPKTISTLSNLKKLLLTVDFDMLATVEVRIRGRQMNLSQLILSPAKAHEHTFANGDLSIPYIVYGIVTAIVRLNKVWYVNMHDGDFYLTIVIFQAYFDKFRYTDEQLLDKRIVVFGQLRANRFHAGKETTEIIIKSDEYIEFLDI